MQTSKKSPVIFSISILLILFILGNAILNYVFTTYISSSYEMWNYFKETQPEIIYTGSSQCLCGIDPETIDNKLGIVSYNMGSNMQSFRSSYIAIKAAKEKKNIKRVVLCIDDEITMLDRNDNFRADASFQHAMKEVYKDWYSTKAEMNFIFTEPVVFHTGSINYFFPWIYDRSSDIKQNLIEKNNKCSIEEVGDRLTSGREPSEEVLDLNYTIVDRTTAHNDIEYENSIDTICISKDSRKELTKIADYCKKNDIELVAITMPYPNALNLYTIDSYTETVADLKDLFDTYGFDYNNFNLVKSDYYQYEISQFKDNGHFNSNGSIAFSEILADYLNETPTERSLHFYTTEEF